MPSYGADRPESDELPVRLKWFLLGRVAVISGFVAMVAVTALRAGRDPFTVPLDRLLPIVVCVYAFSALSAILLPHLRRPAAFAYVQLAVDVALVGGVIFLTGPDSPFVFLYSLPIINGAVLLFGGGALFAAACAALTYDGLLAALAGQVAAQAQRTDPNLGMRVASANLTFGLIAFLASVLTRRLHAAEQLAHQRQTERDHFALLQRTLARAIGSGLVTTDPEGRVTSLDGTAEALIGRPHAAVLGEDLGAIFPPLRLTPNARLRFLQSSATAEPVEFVHRGADGTDCDLRCTGAPLASTFGHPIGALYVFQNVTPLKQLAAPGAAAAADERALLELDGEANVAEPADGLYGASPATARIRTLIERVAHTDATVLISGESGTGKEVVARAIHARGPRRDKRFVAINCGAIPEHLIESELFGHVRGAFTGAVADRPGCFRAADGGTLFLDEIGELPPHLQVKLLRVIQERTFRPVGSETNVAVDVRILAATNRDLAARVKDGSFREDLFYRLNVIAIDIPPLRERRDDIPLLVRVFLRQFSELHGRSVNRFSVGAGRMLLQHTYPGNVRELENIVEHAVALCDGDTATEEHLPAYLLAPAGGVRPPDAMVIPAVGPTPHLRPAEDPGSRDPRGAFAPYEEGSAGASAPVGARTERRPTGAPVDLDHDLAEYEKAILQRALDQAGGVKKRAAELLGINYRSLRHRLQKYGLGDASEDSVVQ